MTNKPMVSVPRELAWRLAHATGSKELHALLTAPAEDVRLMVDEPVAWANDQQLLLCSRSPRQECEGNMLIHNLPRNVAGSALETSCCNTPLYRHPQRPVAMPNFETFQKWMADSQFEHTPYWAWRLCLDEFARLNPH